MTPPTKQFDHLQIQLEAIKSATNNFSQENCIGSGGFGSVYKGELAHSTGRTMVAIKRLNREFGQGDPEFWKEITTLSLHRNKNIVSLLGFCDEGKEKILVYEYISRKSLDLYLDSDDLTWVRRLKICIGAARGLAYLHCPNVNTHQRVLHRDIKSGNILLDQDWNARISDFGLSKVGPANQLHTFLISNPAGTPWYVDPVYVQKGLLTKESDVYSFGVVLFEVLCGRLCYPNDTYKQPLIELVQKYYDQNKIEEIVFDKIKDEINLSSLKTFTTIAYRCLNLTREARPQIKEVVNTLETALYYQEHIPSPPISLRDISPGNAAEPIEVRVVRKWIPSETEIECWYLFVDRNGDAIQVVADLRDLEHFNAIITLQSCYRVTNYICEKCRYIGKIVPHCAIIRIGKAATFLQIDENGFPSHYFNFVTYENLRARLNKRQLLTDYVGKVESTTDTLMIQSNTDCLKIKLLEDPSGEVIEATLLGEVATSFDKDALMHAPSPIIAALTSMKVVENEGALQLTSTSATHVYLDPDIEQAKAIAAKFQGENTAIEHSMSGNKDNESERNRATLAELLKIPTHRTGTRFTCIASIKRIKKRSPWYYDGCTTPMCGKKLHLRGDIMACRDHGDILKPRYMYRVNVTITDHSASASAIFFDEAMTSLLQTECINMVVDQGYTDPNIIPEPLLSMEGQTRIFQLELAKPSGFKSSAHFIIDQVFQTTLPTTITLSTPPSSTCVKRKRLRSQDKGDDAAKKLKPKKNKRIVKRPKN